MSRAPQHDAPTTIEVVQPERTIVRDVDEALPLILSGTALLLVLAGVGLTLHPHPHGAAPGPQPLTSAMGPDSRHGCG